MLGKEKNDNFRSNYSSMTSGESNDRFLSFGAGGGEILNSWAAFATGGSQEEIWLNMQTGGSAETTWADLTV